MISPSNVNPNPTKRQERHELAEVNPTRLESTIECDARVRVGIGLRLRVGTKVKVPHEVSLRGRSVKDIERESDDALRT